METLVEKNLRTDCQISGKFRKPSSFIAIFEIISVKFRSKCLLEIFINFRNTSKMLKKFEMILQKHCKKERNWSNFLLIFKNKCILGFKIRVSNVGSPACDNVWVIKEWVTIIFTRFKLVSRCSFWAECYKNYRLNRKLLPIKVVQN